LKRRRSIRLNGYDYTQAGAYFITVCTYERRCLFGEIINGEMFPNEIGKIVEQTWLETSQVRGAVELDDFVVMPNHFHAIILLQEGDQGVADRKGRAADPGDGIRRGSLGAILAQFKSLVTKRVGASRWLARIASPPNFPFWQRNYYDHIIRNEGDLNRIREYIAFNPQRWSEDQNNPIFFQKKNFNSPD
jgi:putative transposase